MVQASRLLGQPGRPHHKTTFHDTLFLAQSRRIAKALGRRGDRVGGSGGRVDQGRAAVGRGAAGAGRRTDQPAVGARAAYSGRPARCRRRSGRRDRCNRHAASAPSARIGSCRTAQRPTARSAGGVRRSRAQPDRPSSPLVDEPVLPAGAAGVSDGACGRCPYVPHARICGDVPELRGAVAVTDPVVHLFFRADDVGYGDHIGYFLISANPADYCAALRGGYGRCCTESR